MKILFHLAHPAHYHMFKYVIRNLISKGHSIKITINTKDILEQLLINDGIQYENILQKRRKYNTKFHALLALIKKDIKLFQIQINGNYDIMVGTEAALSHIGWLFRKPVLIMDEDDVTVVPEAAKLSFPFATYVVSPVTCNLKKWSKKKIAYNGFQKLAYLHPKYFTPKEIIVNKLIDKNVRFFLIRVSDLSAYHDKDNNGLTIEIIRKIIEILAPHGKILISTERKLPGDLSQYLLQAEFNDIHHYLYYADFLIADSQSMCVEAAILGTPSIRFSGFAGKISVLEELEHKFGLTFGIQITEHDKLYQKINELLQIKNLRQKWQAKRHKMLEDKIDVTAFWTWLIDNYPKSVKVFQKNVDYQNTFRELQINEK
ncbi:MAG: DUF354 domain-containing protein [Bacteroidales bacterium]|nr:DUF354 domain-containing protein [Bacteroidales bacterium]